MWPSTADWHKSSAVAAMAPLYPHGAQAMRPAHGGGAAHAGQAHAGQACAGQAARLAAENPQVQAAVQGALRDAAKDLVKQAARRGVAQLVEVRTYVQENPNILRAVLFAVGLALLVCSGLGMLNVLNIVFDPFQYLFACYNAIFAGIVVVLEGKPDWYQSFGHVQSWIFGQAAFLASQAGRAIFYMFIGTINLLVLPRNWLWRLIYIAMGGSLCGVGICMLLGYLGICCKSQLEEYVSQSSSSSDSESE
mmetsp:Transcript_44996/g.104090  ORF Transcript_44996/g.104090 Transcript_44996/m.104090 type:complete len:250 (-) Transcript_44996:137-886(-)